MCIPSVSALMRRIVPGNYLYLVYYLVVLVDAYALVVDSGSSSTWYGAQSS